MHKRKMVTVCESKSENLQLNVTFIKCSARATIEIFLSRNFLHGFFFDGVINMSVLLSVRYFNVCVHSVPYAVIHTNTMHEALIEYNVIVS